MLTKFFFAMGATLSIASTSIADEAVEAFDFTTEGTKLVTISNDRDASTADLTVVENADGTPSALEWVNRSADRPARKTFRLNQVAQGVVLEEQQGIQALSLQGNIDRNGKGELTFRYVANGMSGKYATCKTNVKRTSGGDYALTNSAGGSAQNAKIITWSFGIETIQGICP